eukprot:1160415-Pelagomonas_calceolata.AAC.5
MPLREMHAQQQTRPSRDTTPCPANAPRVPTQPMPLREVHTQQQTRPSHDTTPCPANAPQGDLSEAIAPSPANASKRTSTMPDVDIPDSRASRKSSKKSKGGNAPGKVVDEYIEECMHVGNKERHPNKPFLSGECHAHRNKVHSTMR